MFTKHKKSVISLSLATFLSVTLSANTNDEMVGSIIKLRGDVESLYSDIKENKQRYNSQMKSLSMQITDSEAQINRQNTSIKLAKSELEKVKVKISESSSGNSEIKPLVENAILLLKTVIQEGIPFMLEGRLGSLEKIQKDLNAGLITNEKALLLTWASYEDTIRVTKEIGLFKQKIDFKGKSVQARIAKIGSVAMYFSTPTNEVGFVEKSDTGYNYKHITNPEDIKQIVALFDALQKQIRTGYFELPNALVLQEMK